MKHILRRLSALLLVLLLTVQVLPPPTAAVLSGTYFTAVNDDLMDLDKSTMPFWSGGQLYVSTAVFSGIYGKSLGIACSPSGSRRAAVLYTVRSALFFDLESDETYDNQDRTYPQRAKERSGGIFLPLDLVVSFFGITYSYVYTDLVPLIRIKNDSVVLTDEMFLDAASRLMSDRYAAYEKAVSPPVPTPPAERPGNTAGQRVYLIFTADGDEQTKTLLNVLDRYGRHAAFLFTGEQIAAEGDLVRAVVGGGHAVGLRSTAASAEEAAAEIRRANDALWEAARLRSRLVWLEKEQDGARSALTEEGFCPMHSRLDYSRSPLYSVGRADTVSGGIRRNPARNVPVFLGAAGENNVGLGRLLSLLGESESRVMAYRETLP